MRKTFITAALTLGMTALAPVMSFADSRHDDRAPQRTEVRHDDRKVETRTIETRRVEPVREVRVERDVRVDREVIVDRDRHFDRGFHVGIYVDPTPVVVCQPNIDVSVSLNDVPGCVLDAEHYQAGNQPISGVQFVRRDGQEFYRFQIPGRYGLTNYRFTVGGSLLGIESAG